MFFPPRFLVGWWDLVLHKSRGKKIIHSSQRCGQDRKMEIKENNEQAAAMRSAALRVRALRHSYLLPPGCLASSFSSVFLAVVIFSALSRSALSATLRNTLP